MPPGLCNRRTVASHQPLATTPSLGHEARSFENAYMFLHRREAHRVQPRQCRNGELGGHRPHHDVPPRRIRQRVKQTIRLRCIYNHMVVDYIQTPFWETSPRAAGPSSPAGNSLAQPMARSAVSLTSSAEPSAQRVCGVADDSFQRCRPGEFETPDRRHVAEGLVLALVVVVGDQMSSASWSSLDRVEASLGEELLAHRLAGGAFDG